MVAHVVIVDPVTRMKARVTEFGQVVVAPVNYSTPVTVEMSSINTPYLLVSPKEGKSVVITAAILTANKSVGVNDATVTIYASDTADGAVTTDAIVSLEMIKNSTLPLTGLNFIVPPGKFILSTTNDATVFITAGYYTVPL